MLLRSITLPATLRPTSPSTRLFSLIPTIHAKGIDWKNRQGLQDTTWTLEEKGWKTAVEWKDTPFGVGVFSCEESIAKDTVLRKGVLHVNLLQFLSSQDIEDWCQADEEYWDRLLYAKDYLWGFSYHTDEAGYELGDDSGDRFFGMWVPGNGLNHSLRPNTVYRATSEGIDLVALEDISKGQELTDDYRRHGRSTEWLKAFASEKNVTLNFADCNDFVKESE